ncbi:LacI family DNA-binding transcriptional regulator [Erwinia sp. V71]|uniref:LacI family DNA-binding transcriptional regulator n=1 Tax=Erwinia sp. V71 TaxID=3369424 RepID=UPI003F649113
MSKKAEHTPRRKATASDVARLAGVSKWTVSRAFTPGASISDNARKQVLAIAKELGYRPNLLARSLSQKRTQIIGVAIDQMKNPHSTLVLDVVTRQLQARGYMALLLNVTEGRHYQSVMAMADQLQVDGILFIGTILTDELIRVARELHDIPLVQVCRHNDAPDEDIDAVNIDGFAAGRQIGELLLAQGYQRFGYMTGPDTGSHHLLRLEGYQDALRAAGKPLDVHLIAGHYERELGYQQMTQYLNTVSERECVDAMFCENDILAIGALEALRDCGKSGRVAIVGFDDIDEASAWKLTSFSQGMDRIIHEALNRLIDGKATREGDWQRGELRVRQSHLKGQQ